MPFDFTPATTDSIANALAVIANPKAKVAAKRTAALAAFRENLDNPVADWRLIASALAAVVPVSKAKAVAEEKPVEWAEYTRAYRHYERRSTVFAFADGTLVPVSLLTPKGKPTPDYARAVRMAVSFYRAKVEDRLRRLTLDRYYQGDGTTISGIWYQRTAASIAVPAIVRAGGADLDTANAYSSEIRSGDGSDLTYGERIAERALLCGSAEAGAASLVNSTIRQASRDAFAAKIERARSKPDPYGARPVLALVENREVAQ